MRIISVLKLEPVPARILFGRRMMVWNYQTKEWEVYEKPSTGQPRVLVGSFMTEEMAVDELLSRVSSPD